MRTCMIFMICLLAVARQSDITLYLQYTDQSSWLISLDNFHLESFIKCLCLETSIECNLRLNSSSGSALEIEITSLNQSQTKNLFLRQYVCTFFYSKHSVVCKRQSRDVYYNSTALFLVDSTSTCDLNCVEWSWTLQQTAWIYKINNNNIPLRYNETKLTCNTTTTMATTKTTPRTSVTSTAFLAKTTPSSTLGKTETQVTTTVSTKATDNTPFINLQPVILTQGYTVPASQPSSLSNAMSSTVTSNLLSTSTNNTVPDYHKKITTAPTQKTDIHKEDSNDTTWIIIGVVIGVTALLVLVIVAIVLCRWQYKTTMSRRQQHIPHGTNIKQGNTSRNNNHRCSNWVTDQTSNDWRDDMLNPASKHISLDQLDHGHMPFIKILVENKVYLNQTSDSHSPVQPNLNCAGSATENNEIKENIITAPVHCSDPTEIDVSKTGPEDTYSNLHSEPVGTYSNIHTEQLGTYSNVQIRNAIEGIHTYIILEEQTRSSSNEGESSPQYSLATAYNGYPAMNHLTSEESEDTPQTTQSYNKLGQTARHESNRYDYISDILTK